MCDARLIHMLHSIQVCLKRSLTQWKFADVVSRLLGGFFFIVSADKLINLILISAVKLLLQSQRSFRRPQLHKVSKKRPDSVFLTAYEVFSPPIPQFVIQPLCYKNHRRRT